MYIIPEHKFCFLASPRTGSKAVARALVEQRGAIRLHSHHNTPDDHPEIEITDDWIVCAAVRNHWDTMVSWWFKIERREMCPLASFLPRFCENNGQYVKENQLWHIASRYANTHLRYEWLSADLDQALVAAGLAPVELPTVIDSKRAGKPYQIFYKADTAAWAANYFKAEIKKYGYKF